LALPDVMKVEYSAIGEVDFCSLRFRFSGKSFSTASTLELTGWRGFIAPVRVE